MMTDESTNGYRKEPARNPREGVLQNLKKKKKKSIL